VSDVKIVGSYVKLVKVVRMVNCRLGGHSHGRFHRPATPDTCLGSIGIFFIYIAQPISPLTHLKKEKFGQNLKIFTHK